MRIAKQNPPETDSTLGEVLLESQRIGRLGQREVGRRELLLALAKLQPEPLVACVVRSGMDANRLGWAMSEWWPALPSVSRGKPNRVTLSPEARQAVLQAHAEAGRGASSTSTLAEALVGQVSGSRERENPPADSAGDATGRLLVELGLI